MKQRVRVCMCLREREKTRVCVDIVDLLVGGGRKGYY